MSTTEPTTRSEQVDKVVEAAGKLITHEVAVSCQEYQLLAKLNDASSAKYNTVAQHTRELLIQSQELSHQQSQLQANFDQIDEILNVALKLEETVVVLEKYMDEVEDHLAK